MSKPSSAKKKQREQQSVATRPASDRTVYIAFIVIGVFVVLLAFPLTDGRNWAAFGIAYVAIMAWLVNLYAFKAYRGLHLANWQSALARLPLRCAGFGVKDHKPLEAARGQAAAMRWIGISVVVSVLLIIGLTLWLVPESRLWES